MENAPLRSPRPLLNRKPARASHPFSSFRVPLAVSMASLFFGGTVAQAAMYNWNNPAGGSWNTTTNFTPNTPSAQGTTGTDTLNFNGTTSASGNNSTGLETISLDNAQSIGTLNFYNTGGTAIVGNSSSSTSTTQTLTFGSGATIGDTLGAGPVTIGGNSMAINLSGTSSTDTFTNSSTNLFTISAPINSSATTVNAIAISIVGQGNTLISGAILPGLEPDGTTVTAIQVLKSGIGTLTLSGASTGLKTIDLGGGTIKLDESAGGSVSSTSVLNLGSGTFTLLGPTAGTTQTFATINASASASFVTPGGGATILVDGGANSTGTTSLTATSLTATVGGSLNITTANGGTFNTSTANTSGILNAHIIYNGSDFAAKQGASTLVGAATTTAFTNTTSSSTANYLVTDSAAPTTATTLANTLKITDTQTGQGLTIGSTNTMTLTTGGVLFVGANDYTISGGTLQSAANDFVVNQYGSGNLAISSTIPNQNGGATATPLTKAGPGTLTLTGANTYTGLTYVNSGTLSTNSTGINSATGGVLVNGVGTVFAPQAGTTLTPGNVTTNTTAIITVQNGATIAPGGVGTIGMLSLNGAGSTGHLLTMGQNTVFAFDLGTNNTSDNITFLNYNAGTGPTTNDLSLARFNTSTNGVTGAVAFAFTGAQAGTYTLFNFYSDNGTTPVTSNSNASYFDLTDSTGLNGYNATLAFNTGSITLTLTAVPEPSTWAWAGGGICVLLALRRVRRKAA